MRSRGFKATTADELMVAYNMTRDQAVSVVDRVLWSLSADIAARGRVDIRNLGTFRVKTRKAKTARLLGRDLTVPQRKAVTFKAHKSLLGLVG